MVAPGSDTIELVDTVIYANLIPGERYKVSGTLHDKADNSIIKSSLSKEPYISEVEFTPDSDTGTVEVVFTVALEDIQGKHVVVFESLMHEADVLAKHEDLDDEDQTVFAPNQRKVFKYDASSNEGLSGAVFVKLHKEAIYVRLPMLWARNQRYGRGQYGQITGREKIIFFRDDIAACIKGADEFETFDFEEFSNKIVHYLYVYGDHPTKKRFVVDNDNHETKYVQDAITMFLPYGDSPFWCSTYSSAITAKKPLTKNDREIKKLFAVANVNISMFTFTVLRAVFGALLGGPCLVLGFLLKPSDFPVYLVPAFAVGMFLAGTLLPKAILRMSANNRRTAIVSSLTDTIDLIAISVEAGLGYDSAILNIWKENKSPAMQELVRTIEDINYGMSRRDAYLSLAARCDVDEMSLFSNNMVQADTMGISIVNVLKAQAEALRVARRRRAETLVQKAPVKMLFPLVFFVFPTMLLVLLGPAIINIEKYL